MSKRFVFTVVFLMLAGFVAGCNSGPENHIAPSTLKIKNTMKPRLGGGGPPPTQWGAPKTGGAPATDKGK